MAPYNNSEFSMKYEKGLGCAFLLLGFTLTHTKSWSIWLINVHDDVAVAGFVVRWLADMSYFETK